MEFYIGQIFENKYPPTAAIWCNGNNAYIAEIDAVDGIRRFEIKEVIAPTPTPEEIVKGYEDAIQAHLDATAQSRGYDNTYTCLSYLSSTDEKWNREAHAFNEWRDAVWTQAHEILNAFIAGTIEQPTIEEVIAQLPAIDWNDPDEE